MPGNRTIWGITVSEGGLEPPCPLRALAPQASASAYSATRTCAGARRSRVGLVTIANTGRPRPSAAGTPPRSARPEHPVGNTVPTGNVGQGGLGEDRRQAPAAGTDGPVR